MAFDLWLAFAAASLALLLIPGPTILLVLSYALTRGRSVAVATAAGVALGDLIAMTASLIGLGAIVAASATAFIVLKWVGAVYLLWLGIKMLRSAHQVNAPSLMASDDQESRSVFWHATLVTALNPKSIGFFLAFVPQFINPSAPLPLQASILVATFVGLAAANALAYALLADRLRQRIQRPAVLRWLTRAGGATLIGMAALTVSLRRMT